MHHQNQRINKKRNMITLPHSECSKGKSEKQVEKDTKRKEGPRNKMSTKFYVNSEYET